MNLETIRFYETKGLLPEPERNAAGYRQYHQGDLQRLDFIKRAQELGFTLREVKEGRSCIMSGKQRDVLHVVLGTGKRVYRAHPAF